MASTGICALLTRCVSRRALLAIVLLCATMNIVLIRLLMTHRLSSLSTRSSTPTIVSVEDRHDQPACEDDAFCSRYARGILELDRVAILRNQVLFFGDTTQAQLNEMHRQAIHYASFNQNGMEAFVGSLRFVAVGSKAPWEPNELCDEIITETVLLSTPWKLGNNFHAIIDNLFAPDWHAQRAGAVARLFLFGARDEKLPVIPLYTDTIELLFSETRDITKELGAGAYICFEHAIWAVGPHPSYRNTEGVMVPSSPSPYWSYAMLDFATRIRALYNVSSTTVNRRENVPLVVFFRRSGDVTRKMGAIDAKQFVSGLRARGADVVVVGVRSRYYHDHPAMLELLKRASCIIGVHGAALAYTMFASPNTVVIELRSQYNAWTRMYEGIAMDLSLRYYAIDFRAQMTPSLFEDLTISRFNHIWHARLVNLVFAAIVPEQPAPRFGDAGSFYNQIRL